jgi:hypothetical protein
MDRQGTNKHIGITGIVRKIEVGMSDAGHSIQYLLHWLGLISDFWLMLLYPVVAIWSAPVAFVRLGAGAFTVKEKTALSVLSVANSYTTSWLEY